MFNNKRVIYVGLGQYHLHPLHQSIKVDAQDIEYLPASSPDEIVRRIKEGSSGRDRETITPSSQHIKQQMPTQPPSSQDAKQQMPTQPSSSQDAKQQLPYSLHARANALVQNNRIAFNPQMHIFNVKGTSDITRVVTLHPRETCSCPSTGVCYHILAVKMSIGIRKPTQIPTKYNLARLRKNTRSRKERKCGRKRPRPKDVKVEDNQSKYSTY